MYQHFFIITCEIIKFSFYIPTPNFLHAHDLQDTSCYLYIIFKKDEDHKPRNLLSPIFGHAMELNYVTLDDDYEALCFVGKDSALTAAKTMAPSVREIAPAFDSEAGQLLSTYASFLAGLETTMSLAATSTSTESVPSATSTSMPAYATSWASPLSQQPSELSSPGVEHARMLLAQLEKPKPREPLQAERPLSTNIYTLRGARSKSSAKATAGLTPTTVAMPQPGSLKPS